MPVSVFSLFLSFAEKEYQTESKRNKTFMMIFLGLEDTQETWRSSSKSHDAATRGRARPLLCGPPVTPPTYCCVLYIHIYSQTTSRIKENNFPLLQPSVTGLVWPTRLVFLATREVLSFGFNLAVFFPSDSRAERHVLYCCHRG